MFDFNAALKRKEEASETARAQAVADDQSKSRNIKTLKENLEQFLRSRNFNGEVKVHGHRLVVESRFIGIVSIVAMSGDRFTIKPEASGRPGDSRANVNYIDDATEAQVTDALVDWIAPDA